MEKCVISSSDDGTVRTWDWSTGQELMVYNPGLPQHYKQRRLKPTTFNSCAAQHGVVVGAAADGNVYLWSVPPILILLPAVLLQPRPGGLDSQCAVYPSVDALQLLICAFNHSVMNSGVRDAKSGEVKAVVQEYHQSEVLMSRFHPSSKNVLVTGDQDGLINVLDLDKIGRVEQTEDDEDEDDLDDEFEEALISGRDGLSRFFPLFQPRLSAFHLMLIACSLCVCVWMCVDVWMLIPSVLNCEQSVRRLGFFGPHDRFMYVLTRIETLQFWDPTNKDNQRVNDFQSRFLSRPTVLCFSSRLFRVDRCILCPFPGLSSDLREQLSRQCGSIITSLVDCHLLGDRLIVVSGNSRSAFAFHPLLLI